MFIINNNGQKIEIATGTRAVDNALSATSTNPVQNRVITESLNGFGTAASKDFTTSVTSDSGDVVTSGAVYSYIDTAITQAINNAY